eukprot:gnl/TRDRNA2_/TRDRNA2_204923_c0_seq1.p1 gnl/TRDRNA2_/TRDRNA2_204923_c0~~gnl/TRDRNA2_/TRDRNA2_204923_c0_seq1.p1  ORF type:complete len:131 (+),score=8.17 gnl/TRDRNA2_/TRDRNA2_204923_c0_seq1:63-455(+)
MRLAKAHPLRILVDGTLTHGARCSNLQRISIDQMAIPMGCIRQHVQGPLQGKHAASCNATPSSVTENGRLSFDSSRNKRENVIKKVREGEIAREFLEPFREQDVVARKVRMMVEHEREMLKTHDECAFGM